MSHRSSAIVCETRVAINTGSAQEANGIDSYLGTKLDVQQIQERDEFLESYYRDVGICDVVDINMLRMALQSSVVEWRNLVMHMCDKSASTYFNRPTLKPVPFGVRLAKRYQIDPIFFLEMFRRHIQDAVADRVPFNQATL
jgi:hypothetical protein